MNAGDADALNTRAAALFRAGSVAQARSLFEEIARCCPDDARAHVNLGFVAFHAGDPAGARSAYARALQLEPTHVQAHHGMAAALDRLGDRAGCLVHFNEACRLAPIRSVACRGNEPGVRVLLLLSSDLGNLDAGPILDARVFAVTTVFVEHVDANAALPMHDVAFNGIGDADESVEALRVAQMLLARSPARCINHPQRVAATARDANAARLRGLPGVRVPRIARVRASDLAADRAAVPGLAYPLLVRSPGYHNGRHFVRVDRREELRERIRELPGDELYAIEFADVRCADGLVRKYRVMIVDGELYPLHLAVARQWKVHYATADMTEVDAHRREDERFLTQMPAVLGQRAIAALESVRDALGLDYGGIDFAIDGAGDVVVFEANASMIVPVVPDDTRFAYRNAPVRRIRDAVTAMLLRKAR
jgi:glutathione synthase/RimK-type ligase-like ATP-grasp enzyme